jgi:hypothetical protein
MKRQVPLILVITLCFLFVGHTFIPHKYSDNFYQWWLSWVRTMTSFAVVLGVMSLFMVHWSKISRRMPNWQYSIVTLLALIFTSASGFIWGTQQGTPYMWLFKNVQMPMSSTMFSLLAFYIASAAYKAFRARSPEATVLLISAIIVMVAQVPLGMAISRWIPEISNWILNVPNLAAKRGVALGVGLGGTAVSLKIMLGIERTYLGSGD